MRRLKVVHLTSAHPPFDPRIFHKEARSLAEAGYDVTVVAPHGCDEEVEGVCVKGVPRSHTRMRRMLITTWKVWWVGLSERGDLYHFHDPELLLAGLALKILGYKVIYDVHEALPEKILSKEWIHPLLRPLVSRAFSVFERWTAKCFDHIVAADQFAARSFRGRRVTVIANYPLLRLAKDAAGKRFHRNRTVLIYVGGLTRDRGLYVMLEIMRILSGQDVDLILLGEYQTPGDVQAVEKASHVKYLGVRPLPEVYEQVEKADVGLLLLQPVPAFSYAGENTTKLFEYMIAGIPVIASNFPNLRRIVEESRCGFCVDPSSPEEVAKVVSSLCRNPDLKRQLGENGRRAVREKLNWEGQSQVLLQLYRQVLDGKVGASSPEHKVLGAGSE